MRRVLFAVLVAVTLITSPAQAKDTIKLACHVVSYQPGIEIVADEYMAAHPDIDINLNFIDKGMETWLETQFAGGEEMAPDLYPGNYTWKYQEQGRWVLMNPYFKQISPYTGEPWGDSFDQAIISKFAAAGGRNYIVPFDFIAVGILYNKDIFEANGYEVPSTWHDMIALCEQIEKDGYIPFAMPGNTDAFWNGRAGWVVRMLTDAYFRDMLPMLALQPEDANYEYERNGTWVQDFSDPYDDILMTYSSERKYNAIIDGVLRFKDGVLQYDERVFTKAMVPSLFKTQGTLERYVREYAADLPCFDRQAIYAAKLEPFGEDTPRFPAGVLRFDGPRMRSVYAHLYEFSRYWQPGFMGADDGSAHNLFINRRAVMEYATTASVTSMIEEMNDLRGKKGEMDESFEWGTFPPPNITNDPVCKGTIRDTGGPGLLLTATKKSSKEHEKNVMDFFMYLTRPESMQTIMDAALANKRPITGPPVIKGVKLPADLQKQYDTFLGRGFEKITFSGLDNDQESVFEWVALLQDFLADRITLDEYLAQYQRIMVSALPRLIEASYADLDPATDDLARVRAEQEAQGFQEVKQPLSALNGTIMVGGLWVLFLGFLLTNLFLRTAPGKPMHHTTMAYLMILPTFLLVLTFSYYPAIAGLCSAFTHWETGEVPQFNGLQNFGKMVSDRFVLAGITNQIILVLAAVIKATVVPFLVAELIVALKSKRLQYLFRTSFLVPMVVPGMVGLMLWKFVYDPELGILNNLLSAIGLDGLRHAWLGEANLALGSIIGMGFPWIGAFGLLIYLAGLMNIPASITDAAKLDCLNFWQRIWHIDVPMVKGQTKLMVILTLIGAVQEFQNIYILTNGGPGISTIVPALRMYHVAFRFGHFGYGASIGFVLFLVILVLTIINLKYVKSVES